MNDLLTYVCVIVFLFFIFRALIQSKDKKEDKFIEVAEQKINEMKFLQDLFLEKIDKEYLPKNESFLWLIIMFYEEFKGEKLGTINESMLKYLRPLHCRVEENKKILK